MDTLKNSRGFTMLEIMITIVIIGILASMATPRFLNFIQRMKGRAEASRDVSFLRSARSEAVSSGTPTGVKLNNVNKSLFVFQDIDGDNIYTAGIDSITAGPITLSGSTILKSCSFGNNTVIFNTNGTANSSGSFVFTYEEDTTRVFTISITAATGKVRMTTE